MELFGRYLELALRAVRHLYYLIKASPWFALIENVDIADCIGAIDLSALGGLMQDRFHHSLFEIKRGTI